MENNKPWYVSSTGQGVSLTIRGIVVALVPVIIAVARNYNIELTQSGIIEVVDAVLQAVAGSMIVVGLVRKLAIKFKTR